MSHCNLSLPPFFIGREVVFKPVFFKHWEINPTTQIKEKVNTDISNDEFHFSLYKNRGDNTPFFAQKFIAPANDGSVNGQAIIMLSAAETTEIGTHVKPGQEIYFRLLRVVGGHVATPLSGTTETLVDVV